MAVFTRKQNGPAGGTNRIGHKTVVETNAFFCNSVNIRCVDQFTAIGAYCLFGMIVTHDKNDIRGS